MYIVIEMFNIPTVVTNEDGEVLYFDTIEEAQVEADDCQDGKVTEC